MTSSNSLIDISRITDESVRKMDLATQRIYNNKTYGIQVIDLKEQQLKELVSTSINNVYIDLSIKETTYNKDDLKVIKLKTFEDIKSDFFDYTDKEISEAFRMGSRGLLPNTDVGFSPVIFYKWIKAYKIYSKTILNQIYAVVHKNIDEFNAEIEKNDSERIQNEFLVFINSKVIEIIESMRSGSNYEFEDVGNVMYNYLKSVKLADVSDDFFEKEYQKSVALYCGELTQKNQEFFNRGNFYIYKAVDVDNIKKRLILKDVLGMSNHYNLVMVMCQKELLKKWFEAVVSDVENTECVIEYCNKIIESTKQKI